MEPRISGFQGAVDNKIKDRSRFTARIVLPVLGFTRSNFLSLRTASMKRSVTPTERLKFEKWFLRMNRILPISY